MNYTVTFSLQAEADIREIYEYISFVLMSPINASNQISRIEDAIKSLTILPDRYPKYDKKLWLTSNLHIMPVDNYIVFYIVDNLEYAVKIMRIMYSRQNWTENIKIDK